MQSQKGSRGLGVNIDFIREQKVQLLSKGIEFPEDFMKNCQTSQAKSMSIPQRNHKSSTTSVQHGPPSPPTPTVFLGIHKKSMESYLHLFTSSVCPFLDYGKDWKIQPERCESPLSRFAETLSSQCLCPIVGGL